MKPPSTLPEITSALARAALAAPCAKDSRAAALVSPGGLLLTLANNGPPFGFRCTRDAACAATCGRGAVHAEMRALLGVELASRANADMFHLRVDATGEPQPSRSPRCVDCTKHMLDAGVAALWLWHGRDNGWKRYPMVEAHALSAAARGVHAERPS